MSNVTIGRNRLGVAIVAFAAALAFQPVLGADLELFNTLPGKPRLANLEIEIWPEYDRPAVLVFLKGKLASRANQAISLRLPASSGGPSAVAQSSTEGGNLLDLAYERINAKDFITLRIRPQDRFFHVEFYDKLDTVKEKRSYRYVWPGDFAVDRLSVHVQQPSTSTAFAITPEFSDSGPGNDTLIYWTKDMGAVPEGKALPITIGYAKSDARTSKELLGTTASAAADAPTASALLSGLPASDSGDSAPVDPRVHLVLAVIFALLAVVVAGFFIWRRRRLAVTADTDAGFCTQCRNPLRAGDRFCSKCGAAVSGRKRA